MSSKKQIEIKINKLNVAHGVLLFILLSLSFSNIVILLESFTAQNDILIEMFNQENGSFKTRLISYKD